MLKINEIKYVENLNNLDNVVTQVNWEYSLEGFQTISGALQLPQPIEETFIPIEDITKEVCLEWVKKLVNPESMQLQEIQQEPEIKTISFE